MLAYTIKSSNVKDTILIPKYYDPELNQKIALLAKSHDLLLMGTLVDSGTVIAQTGHEIGKMAYGTGNIPFVRTSDISNWEIKTIPKQGVAEEVYNQYSSRQDVQAGDILMVRDGTYLIGTNCIITLMDIPMLYQSHILKFRIVDKDYVDPNLLFLGLNCSLVQNQIRNMQFTADIIDTLGSRYKEIIIPIPKDKLWKDHLRSQISSVIETRVKYKAAIKQMPLLLEQVLDSSSIEPFDSFFDKSSEVILSNLVQDTTTLEFGEFSAFRMRVSQIRSNVLLPKYYDPSISGMLDQLSKNCMLRSIEQLIDSGDLELSTGDEIGKMAYGSGDIPFVRTSDFSNWEIKADTKQGVSEEIYMQYAAKEDVQAGDILIVRDGTYLVGTSCIVTETDTKMLFCGGLIKIRSKNKPLLDEYLLLGLLNSYIVKRQIRTKQFTRDVIDTLGQRLKEVILPIPNSNELREQISSRIKTIVHNRVDARVTITQLSEQIISGC